MAFRNKYHSMVGKNFGKLIFSELIDIKSDKNRISHKMIFTCECGTKKEFTSKRAYKIFCGETISCGCVKKIMWAREYHTWKKILNESSS